MENAKKFFEKIVKTDEAKALLAAVEAPKTEEDRIAAYIEIAKKLGVELTAEDIQEYFATASDADVAELDDEELEQLVGGDNAGCKDTFLHKENCWWEDGCDNAWNNYEGYQCSARNLGYTISLSDQMRAKIEKKYYPMCYSHSVNEKLKEKGFI
jgi:predicted ribosomally synthesized peptide with nif11-like leader